MSSDRRISCVVTGGRGFAARHLVEMLIRSNIFSVVTIADLGPSIKLESHEENGFLGDALRSGDAQYVSADLRDKSLVIKAFQGAQVVFHMAAPDSSINNHDLHYSVNVKGTENVINACIECKVRRLIYTSSPSVVFDGVHGIFNGDESMPYPSKHNDSYSATKAEGEALVIKANGKNGLLTCCIRPSSIFGPGDRLLVPSLVTAARAGKSKFIIGDGNNMYDFTYVENVAHAHLCAEVALSSEGAVAERAAGQAYFITNMEPIKFWEFVSLILEGLGYGRPSIKIPSPVVMPIAQLVEWTYKMLAPYGMRVPQLTPSRVRLLSCNRTFSCSKANDRLGYEPIISLQEGLERTIASYSHLRAEKKPQREGPSKATVYLGGGKIANTLLWRDIKQTLVTIVILFAFYSYFIASGSTIITSVSKLLLLATLFLFVHGILPNKMFGYTIDKIPASNFHFPQRACYELASQVGSVWNTAANILNSLCRAEDWTLLLKVVISLIIFSLLGASSVQSIFTIGMPLAFVVFYLYEKMEDDIDAFMNEAVSHVCKIKSNVVTKFQRSK